MISPNIQKLIQEAMKAKDETRLSTLRLLASALAYEKIAQQKVLTEVEELAVVKKEAKKREDAVKAYTVVGAIQRAEQEKKELEILKSFLPPQMSDEEIRKIVEETIVQLGVSDPSGMGRVIGAVKTKTGVAADGAKIAQMVKVRLAPKESI